MNSTRDPYIRAGAVLMAFGVPFALYSYLVLLDVTFTALGLASVVLGATALLIPSSPVPAGTVRAMVEGASVNVEALLEEYDASSKGYYLPPVDDRVYCFVPLSGDVGQRQLDMVMNSPIRVIVDVAGIRGLMVCPSCKSYLPENYTLECKKNHGLLKSHYSPHFKPDNRKQGIWKYHNRLPVDKPLKLNSGPKTIPSTLFAEEYGLKNVHISFNGYWPEKEANVLSCSFKEYEAMTTLPLS